jgi:hypothetical protein
MRWEWGAIKKGADFFLWWDIKLTVSNQFEMCFKWNEYFTTISLPVPLGKWWFTMGMGGVFEDTSRNSEDNPWGKYKLWMFQSCGYQTMLNFSLFQIVRLSSIMFPNSHLSNWFNEISLLKSHEQSSNNPTELHYIPLDSVNPIKFQTIWNMLFGMIDVLPRLLIVSGCVSGPLQSQSSVWDLRLNHTRWCLPQL